jgi:hypothetical protein
LAGRQAADARVRHCNRLDIADLHVDCVHQRVDTLDTRDEFEAPADVECGARR